MVTGGGRGVGRAIVERLAGAGGTVVIIERDETNLDWVPDHPAAARLSSVIGSASDEDVAEAAADQAEAVAPLGTVPNRTIRVPHSSNPACTRGGRWGQEGCRGRWVGCGGRGVLMTRKCYWEAIVLFFILCYYGRKLIVSWPRDS